MLPDFYYNRLRHRRIALTFIPGSLIELCIPKDRGFSTYIWVVKIMAFLFLALVSFFTAQPLMSNLGLFIHAPAGTVADCCGKRMDCQSQKSPANHNPSNHNRKCAGDECNPFMSCVYGNFFLVAKSSVDQPDLTPAKEKETPLNDNRLAAGFSESWHPPEAGFFHTS